MKKKKVLGASSECLHQAAMESVVLSALHPLIAHCAVTRYEDGDKRLPGWWTVTTSGVTWKVTVKDPDSAASFAVTAPTLDEALTLACLLLESEEAPWEHDQWLQKGRARRK